jgi:hypothetical protein
LSIIKVNTIQNANGTTGITFAANGQMTLANTPLQLTGGQIKFPSTKIPSADGNTLDDYEEGTWTPVDSTGAGLTFSINASPRYTKIGNIVNVNFFLTYPGTASGVANGIGGLPFTISPDSYIAGYVFTNSGQNLTVYSGGGTAFQMRDNSNFTPANSTFSSKFVSVNFTYTVA